MKKFITIKLCVIFTGLIFFACERNSLYDIAKKASEYHEFNITSVAKGTTEMSTQTNLFFDGDVNLCGLATGDIIYNVNSHDGAYIDNTSQTFCHELGQNIQAISPGDTYLIASSSNIMASNIAQDHQINPSGASFVSGSGQLFTNHQWNPTSWVGPNDIVYSSALGIYARIVGLTPVSLIRHLKDGTNNTLGNTVIDGGGLDWTTIAALDNLIISISDNVASRITGITPSNLTLEASIFSTAGDPYSLYDGFCSFHSTLPNQVEAFYVIQLDSPLAISSGSSYSIYDSRDIYGVADTPPSNPLFDNEGNFTFAQGGDIVVNFTNMDSPFSPNVAVVDSSYQIRQHSLNLSQNIFTTSSEEYEIIRVTQLVEILDTGFAEISEGSLKDSSSSFSNVLEEDIVYSFNSQKYAEVMEVSAGELKLSNEKGTMSFAAGDRYIILRRY